MNPSILTHRDCGFTTFRRRAIIRRGRGKFMSCFSKGAGLGKYSPGATWPISREASCSNEDCRGLRCRYSGRKHLVSVWITSRLKRISDIVSARKWRNNWIVCPRRQVIFSPTVPLNSSYTRVSNISYHHQHRSARSFPMLSRKRFDEGLDHRHPLPS